MGLGMVAPVDNEASFSTMEALVSVGLRGKGGSGSMDVLR